MIKNIHSHIISSTIVLSCILGILVPGFASAQITPHIRLPNRNYNPVASPYSAKTEAVGTNVDASNLSGPQSETNITIDPTNPARILAGSNDISGPTMRAYYSTNSGASFSGSAPSRVINGFTFSFTSDPGVAFDLNGNAFYSYLVIRTDNIRNGLVVAKSTTGGATWLAPATIALHTTVSPTPPFEDKPLMTIDTNTTSPFKNNIYVSWDSNLTTGIQQVMLARSTTDGASFLPAVQVDDPGTSSGGVIYADPAVGPNGEVYVVWNDYGTDPTKIIVDKSTTGGATWGTDVVIDGNVVLNIFSGNTGYFIPAEPDRGIAATPAIDVDRSSGPRKGWVYVAWGDRSTAQDDIRIYFSRSTDGGHTWSTKKQVNDDTTTRSHFFSWLSVDPTDGTIHMSWYDCRNDPNNQLCDVYYTRSTDGGLTFIPNIKVTSATSDESINDANRDSGNNYGDYEGIAAFNGVAYPVWTDTRQVATLGEEVYVARITNTVDSTPPTAGFFASPTTGYSALTVIFTDTSANSPTSWNWSFGDGSTGNIQNPTHVYTVSGTTSSFNVQLIVTNSFGTSTSLQSGYITVLPLPAVRDWMNYSTDFQSNQPQALDPQRKLNY